MHHLLHHWEEIKKRIRNKKIFLFLDYDGTLAPIAPKPSEAGMPEKTRRLLREMARKESFSIAIVSGRMLKDLKRQVAVPYIIYSGNHGMEIEGTAKAFQGIVPDESRQPMRKIARQLHARLRRVCGVIIEDKQLTVTLHYRLVSPLDLLKTFTIFNDVTRPYQMRHKIAIRPGKKVLEITPPIRWNKGKAIQWVLAHERPEKKIVFPIAAGDDISDETAFAAVAAKGFSVLVGKPRQSAADYYVKNTEELREFLRLLNGIC